MTSQIVNDTMIIVVNSKVDFLLKFGIIHFLSEGRNLNVK